MLNYVGHTICRRSRWATERRDIQCDAINMILIQSMGFILLASVKLFLYQQKVKSDWSWILIWQEYFWEVIIYEALTPFFLISILLSPTYSNLFYARKDFFLRLKKHLTLQINGKSASRNAGFAVLDHTTCLQGLVTFNDHDSREMESKFCIKDLSIGLSDSTRGKWNICTDYYFMIWIVRWKLGYRLSFDVAELSAIINTDKINR